MSYQSCCDYTQDTAYESQTSAVKLNHLWSKVIADTSSGSYPNVAGIFVESVVTSFRNVSDEMPAERLK